MRPGSGERRPKPPLPFEFCPAPKSRPDVPPPASEGRRALCREQPQGGSRGRGCAWGPAPDSLLLRRDTDCSAVLFLSSAAFCCCETERETPRTAVTQRWPLEAQGGSQAPWEDAGTVAEGVGALSPGLGTHTPTAAGWPAPPRFRGAPRPGEAGGTRGKGWPRGGRDRQEGAAHFHPRPGRPSCGSPSA